MHVLIWFRSADNIKLDYLNVLPFKSAKQTVASEIVRRC